MSKAIGHDGSSPQGEILPPLPTRPQLRDLWQRLMAMPDRGDELLPERLAHFQAGTPLSEVYGWFLASHAELDATEPPVVHVRFARALGSRELTIPGRDVRLRHDGFFVDGVAVPQLASRTILGIRTRGTVYNEGGFRIRGPVNGVYTSMDRRAEPPPPDIEPAPPGLPRR